MRKNLFLAMLLSTSFLSAQEINVDTSLTSDEEGVVQQYWYWAGGISILGEDFAPNSEITVTSVDPDGKSWRDFTGTSETNGTFNIQINAMKNRSVTGTHTVTAKDTEGHTATATFEVIKSPNEVLVVKINPEEVKSADFLYGDGVSVTINNLTPNGLVKINLGTPDSGGMEIDPATEKYADQDGKYTFTLNGNTEVGSPNLIGTVPDIFGIWGISAHDFAGTNNTGFEDFRVWPNNPSQNDYCLISGSSDTFAITSVELNDLTNTSSVTSNQYYEDFSAKSASLENGKTYDIKIKGKNMNAWTVDTYTAFIDWNQNGVLDEDGEVVSLGFLKDSSGEDDKVMVGKITVPEEAKVGEARMRLLKVRSISSTALFWPSGSCGSYYEGQVEDYTLKIGNLGVQDVTNSNTKIYPNPVKDVLNLSNANNIQKVSIVDITGRQVFTKELNTKNAQINIAHLNAGVYIVKTLVNNQENTFKIVKK